MSVTEHVAELVKGLPWNEAGAVLIGVGMQRGLMVFVVSHEDYDRMAHRITADRWEKVLAANVNATFDEGLMQSLAELVDGLDT